MPSETVNDLDYLAARLHGRRSRLAEARRLDGLCRLPNVNALGDLLYPATEFRAVGDFQRRLAEDLCSEMTGFQKHLEAASANLLAWMLARFQVENLKVLLRRLLRRNSLQPAETYLLPLPHRLALDVAALMSARSLEDFTRSLPARPLRKSLTEALDIYHDQPRLFLLEAALDRGYFQELLNRAERLSVADQELVLTILFQEVDAFHLMLVVRGIFHYGLTPELLLPLHVRGSGITSERFSAMLAAPDIAAVASLAIGRAIDDLPSEHGPGGVSATVDASLLETLVWRRYARLSNRAFRRRHMGLAAVVGYVGIRRVEVANLITLSQGLGTGMAAETLRARLHPRLDLESVHV